jgi:hypothetical protein
LADQVSAWSNLDLGSGYYVDSGKYLTGTASGYMSAHIAVDRAPDLHTGLPPKDVKVLVWWKSAILGGHVATSLGNGKVLSSWGDNKWHDTWSVDDLTGLLAGTAKAMGKNDVEYMGWSESVPVAGTWYKVVKQVEDVNIKPAKYEVGDMLYLLPSANNWNGGAFIDEESKGQPFVVAEVRQEHNDKSEWGYRPMFVAGAFLPEQDVRHVTKVEDKPNGVLAVNLD